ncbi:MAG: CDP-archaeol synthase [Oligoflexia bacterium]|nr:CDP-archaeol synthase [Oligoflexia bacterium]
MISTYLLHSLLMILPLAIAGILHMIFVKLDLLKFLKVPLSEKLFGKNKTYRGIILMSLFSIIGVYAASPLDNLLTLKLGFSNLNNFNQIILGTLLGLGYTLSELPNSFIKRRLGIAVGKKTSNSKYKIIQIIFDQADSSIGCVLVYYFYMGIAIQQLLAFIFLGIFIHLFFNVTLYLAKIRKEPF